MRILHVIQRYWPYVGGSERHLQEISERLVRDGHQVMVVTTDAFDLELFWARGKKRIETRQEEHKGVTIRRFPVRHIAPFRLAYPIIRRVMLALSDLPVDTTRLIWPLARLTPWIPDLGRALGQERARFDVVAAMNIVFDALIEPAWRLARRSGAAFIVYPLTHLGEAQQRTVRRYYTMRHQLHLLRQADAMILQNDIERAALAGLGVDVERSVVAGPGVNPAEILGGDGDRARRRHGIAGPTVLFLGTAARDKGAHDSLEAMKRLWAHGSEATLVFAGPVMDQFTSFYERQPQQVRNRCRVLGFVSEDDKRDLLAACDLLVMPSRTDSFGIVFLEAWLYGKPVIGARAGGIPAVINDGQDGMMVAFGDQAALAAAIERLLSDSDLACRLGEAGRRTTLAKHTWDHKYAIVRQVYERVAQAGGKRDR